MTYFPCAHTGLNYKRRPLRPDDQDDLFVLQVPTIDELQEQGIVPDDNLSQRTTRSRQGYSSDDYT